MSTAKTKDLGGFYFIAPASDPSDRHAAGYDGNRFADAAEAEREIPNLRAIGPDFDIDWVVRFCDHS